MFRFVVNMFAIFGFGFSMVVVGVGMVVDYYLKYRAYKK